MDKYFDANYDPRFDVSIPDLTQSNGLIAPGAFEGWDNMLSVIKDRKEEKKLKEAREKEARKAERDRVRKERENKRKARRGERESSEEIVVHGPSKGMMDMTYTKKGATREWDRGKEL